MRKISSEIFLFTLLFLTMLLPVKAEDWAQDAHDAQRTGYTNTQPDTPWSFRWSFNGPDANGGTGNHLYNAPKEARTVTGGNNIYVPGGSYGLYALTKSNGQQLWRITETSFMATPAYTNGFVYAGGTNGKIYKVNASDGSFTSYPLGNAIQKAVLLVDPFIYVVTDAGQLFKLTTDTLQPAWSTPYSANSTIATLPSYSPSRDIIVFATDDLYVHAVNNSDRSQKWRVKPSDTRVTAGFPNEFEFSWPVIAEKHGIVFLRMRLAHSVMDAHGKFPSDQSETQKLLAETYPYEQNLFALSLDSGQKSFIPAVGYGSTEDFLNGSAYGAMGSQPVIKTWENGDEVAYIHFRNGQRNGVDYRWDSHLGEMVLDNTTVPGFKAGYLRFITASAQESGGSGYDFITDEQTPLTVAGNVVLNSHWAALTSHAIDPSINNGRNNKEVGLTLASKIPATRLPSIVRAKVGTCSNISSHLSSSGINYVTDGGGRYFGGPAFFIYCNTPDPPGWRYDPNSMNTGISDSYSAGFLPRYAYVADNLLIVEGNGGDISVFTHSGSTTPQPTATTGTIPTPSRTPTASVTPSPTPMQGDLTGDRHVTSADIVAFLSQLSFSIFTYNSIIANYGK